MKRLRFRVTLTLRGPVLTQSSAPATFGVDAAVARVACGPDADKPCLHGTHFKGKVRESLEQLHRAGAIKGVDLRRWFGFDTQSNTGNEPERGCLHFGDLSAEVGSPRHGHRHGIAIEPILGSVKGEMLRAIETPFAAGEEVVFRGPVWCYGDSENHVAKHLRLGLRWLTQIGAERTTGFGRVLQAEVEPDPETPVLSELPADVTALELAIRPLGPLCVSKHKIGGNLFESEEFIPGNMLAGALLETAKALDPNGGQWSALRHHFDELVFRHAFPTSADGVRPPVLPLSTVCAGTVLYDVADLRAPHLLKDEHGHWRAPAFPIDWKGEIWAEAERQLGCVHPARELRVRTQIDTPRRMADRGTPATGGALFAWEMVHPWTGGSGDGSWQPLVWKGRIELGAIADSAQRRLVAEQLAALLPQLGFVSKTKAACAVTVTAAPGTRQAELRAGQPLVLVLRTPALLADPRFQAGANGSARHGPLDAVELLRLYRTAFDELSESSLQLDHYFAQQFLAGGNHLALRFQLKHQPVYDPWLLTAPGSVFVFTVKDQAKAGDRLAEWLQAGLPLPAWAEARYTADWRKNPFLPQNGFGEVALHQPRFAPPEARPITSPDPILP